jgi:hypothetical protein
LSVASCELDWGSGWKSRPGKYPERRVAGPGSSPRGGGLSGGPAITVRISVYACACDEPLSTITHTTMGAERADLLDRLQRPYRLIGEDFVDGVASIWIGQIDMQNVVPKWR